MMLIKLVNKVIINTFQGLLLPISIPIITRFIKTAGAPQMRILIYSIAISLISSLGPNNKRHRFLNGINNRMINIPHNIAMEIVFCRISSTSFSLRLPQD